MPPAPVNLLAGGGVQGFASGGDAMQSQAEERALLKAIAAGDAKSLERLFARAQTRVFRFLMRVVKRQEIAEELLNEVFLSVWQNAHRYEGRSEPLTWVLSIAHNKAMSALRKKTEVLGIADEAARDLVAEEEAFLGSHVRALLVALAEKYGYTEEHTRRVALRAVQVGDELGLAPERLRDLAVGGLLHDIGKLSVPNEVLKKPGPLTDGEFALVKRHVDTGVALLHDLGGFSGVVHRLVRSHHERLDGSGYPGSAQGEAIPLDVRILAVCDVYDALLSTRVYRAAWSHERALALLRDGSGTLFDPRCIDALERVLMRERAEGLAVAV